MLDPHYEDHVVPVVLEEPDHYRALAVALHVGNCLCHVERGADPTHCHRIGDPGCRGFHLVNLRLGERAHHVGSVRDVLPGPVAHAERIAGNQRHEFWPDNASYHDIPVAGIIGHRQVTDAYLAHLARSYSARLATFDQTLAKLHPDVADLIPAA